jgi:hypothetical protein
MHSANTKISACGSPILLARNGVDRGVCSRAQGHCGSHSNRTCPCCAGALPPRSWYCRRCSHQYASNHDRAKAEEFDRIVAENQTLNAACEQLEKIWFAKPADTPLCELVVIDGIWIKIPILELAEV